MSHSKDNSIEFSLGDEADLKNLLQNINSSYSIEPSCSFEYYNEINEEMLFNDKEKAGKQNKTEKRVPVEVKQLTGNFIDGLFSKYIAEESKISGNNKGNHKSDKGIEKGSAISNSKFQKKPENINNDNKVIPDTKKNFLNFEDKLIPSSVGSASYKKNEFVSTKITSFKESKKLHRNLIPKSSNCIRNKFEEDNVILHEDFLLPVINDERPLSKIKSKHKKNSNLESYSPLNPFFQDDFN